MSGCHRRFFAVLVLASGPIAIGVTTASDAPKEKPPRLDLFGDPLPTGAVARLGTMRLCYAACMAFSPDGKVVATAQGNNVHLWDAATGKPLRRLTVPRFGWAHTVAFSPNGRKIAVLDNLGIHIAVWQVDKESPLFTAQIQRQGGVHQLKTGRIVFSPDSKTLYTGNDQTVHAWDATTDKETYRFRHGKPNETRTNTIVFSRDGKLFVTASDSKFGFHLWDTHSGKLLHHLIYPVGGAGGEYCAAFSPDGTLLATGGCGNYLWDVQSGKTIRMLETATIAVAFTPDGKGLATAHGPTFIGDVGTIRLWDLRAGAAKPRKTITAPGVQALEYSPDGKTLAWIGGKQSVRLLEAATGEERLPFESHNGDVNSVAYSPDGRLIATASSDHTIRLWDADSAKPKGVLRGHTDAVNALAFSPDGKWLASASNDTTAILWDVEKRKIRFPCKGHDNRVHAVAFTPDGKTLVIGGHNYFIQSWDVGRGKELRTINGDGDENSDNNWALDFSPDGKLLASAGDNSFRLHDARSGKRLGTVKAEPGITSLAFSPDGRTLACGCMRWTILWERASGKERARLPGHWNQRGALAFSPDGKWLASGSHDPGGDMDQVVHVWELATGKELGAFVGHEQPVFGVAFSPDGKRLATAGGDATTLIWDLAAVAARGPHPRLDNRSLKSPPDAKDLEAAWSDLAGDDTAKAQQAIWMLARQPRQAAAFLGQRLRPADKPDAGRVASLIDDLDSDRFATREQAGAELARLGASAEPILRKKRAGKISLEMRKRIDLLLEKLDVLAPLSGEELRNVRAVEALEQAGTREARQVLRRLAGGSECARLTREAKASLQRLGRHPTPSP